jgi:GMP synthase (glutamine-hydrolysing)
MEHYPTRGGKPPLGGVDAVVTTESTAGVYGTDEWPWIHTARALVRRLVARENATPGVYFGHRLAGVEP